MSERCALPDLPAGLKFGAGVRVGRRLYAGLGTLGRRWLVLDLDASVRVWRDLPEFPGCARDQAVAVGIDGAVHVYGGAGSESKGAPLQVLDDVYRFDIASQTWAQQPGRIPGGQLGAAAIATADGRVLFFGGVHKPLFDSFLAGQAAAAGDVQRAELSVQYLSRPAGEYRFSRTILCHEPVKNRWSHLEGLLDPGVVGAAIALAGDDVTLINGEVKPGVRTPLVQAGRLRPHAIQWQPAATLSSALDGSSHEGLAGAMCGHARGVLLCAGGTNFPGAAARFMSGQLYAHRGLAKAWARGIFARRGEVWAPVGQLAQGRAHGLAFEFDDRLWVVGGETEGGAALADTVSLAWAADAVPDDMVGP